MGERESEREARMTAWVERERHGEERRERGADLCVGVLQWVCKSGYAWCRGCVNARELSGCGWVAEEHGKKKLL